MTVIIRCRCIWHLIQFTIITDKDESEIVTFKKLKLENVFDIIPENSCRLILSPNFTKHVSPVERVDERRRAPDPKWSLLQLLNLVQWI